tara:strand:- start:237 stop:482 length:246 start_codon:yes stop_codon:yes gene_type:complete
MIACGCGRVVEQARIELNLKRCKQCAFSDDVERPKGVMIYSHKTGGQIEIHSADSWKEKRKYYVPNGARSAVKNFSKNTCA